MKNAIIIIAFVLFGAFMYAFGRSQAVVITDQKPVFYSREYMYNVYILKNCLKELQTLKGGE